MSYRQQDIMRSRFGLLLAMGMILGLSASAQAQSESESPESKVAAPSTSQPIFGGPSGVGGQLKKDKAVRAATPGTEGIEGALIDYFAFKDRLKAEHGLSFGLDYNALAQVATSSPGDNFAASGVARLFGQWTLVGRNSKNAGSLVFKGESRHSYGGTLTPQELGPEIGYAGLTGVTFSKKDWILTNFYWEQHLLDGALGFVVGDVDTTDYVNSYALFNPWADFSNLVFLNSATIPAPNQGLGAAASVLFAEHFYVLAGIADANGDPTQLHDFFDSFFCTAEFFTHVEFGWIGSMENKYEDNIHVTAWRADEREEAGVARGWGMNFSWNQPFSGGWQPFFRAGFAEDGGAVLSRSVSVGCAYTLPGGHDQVALGLNWGRPAPDTYGSGLPDQFTADAWFRIQVTKVLAISPMVQLLVNPALNPDDDVIAVFGLRVRFSF